MATTTARRASCDFPCAWSPDPDRAAKQLTVAQALHRLPGNNPDIIAPLEDGQAAHRRRYGRKPEGAAIRAAVKSRSRLSRCVANLYGVRRRHNGRERRIPCGAPARRTWAAPFRRSRQSGLQGTFCNEASWLKNQPCCKTAHSRSTIKPAARESHANRYVPSP